MTPTTVLEGRTSVDACADARVGGRPVELAAITQIESRISRSDGLLDGVVIGALIGGVLGGALGYALAQGEVEYGRAAIYFSLPGAIVGLLLDAAKETAGEWTTAWIRKP